MMLISCGCTQAAGPSGFVLMPVGTDVSCEDMFADESDFEFDVENERAVASTSTGTEAKQAQAVSLTAQAVPLTAATLTAQAVPLTAQAVPLTAHTSKVLGNVRFLFSLITYTAVLGIRDFLVRIRILGSVPLTNGSGPDFFLQ
jgi:hypothetical protein